VTGDGGFAPDGAPISINGSGTPFAMAGVRANLPMSHLGLASRVTPVHTAMRNSTRDEGGPFEVDNQVLISSHRKLLWSKAMVVSVAEKPKQDSGRHD
jgi:hypothetical protein